MIEIDSSVIEEAVYNLCIKANTEFEGNLYELLYERYNSAKENALKIKYENILKNIELANEQKRPLCQDTGQVIVFVNIGQDVHIKGKNLPQTINSAVEKAYTENFFRKSVVKNAIFNRTNTNTNTPAVIYTEFSNKNDIEISVLIKGAGSENYSAIKMFKPSSTKEEIYAFIKDSVKIAGEKSCPPLVLGIGIGGTMDSAAVLSKKSFFEERNTIEETEFINELNKYLSVLNEKILDIKLLSSATHIACLPVALTINCHSTRHAKCFVKKDKIEYCTNRLNLKPVKVSSVELKEIKTSDVKALQRTKKNEQILLTGEIYTARDAAHEMIKAYYDQNGVLPFEIKGKIIFYAGPCPATPDEVIGPIGPTTSARMDKFCAFFHKHGLLASVGKGERSEDAYTAIKKYKGKYFTAQGGVACLLSQCVKSSQIIAFENLGTEAVRKLYVEKLPVKVEI